jgi:threonine synthase
LRESDTDIVVGSLMNGSGEIPGATIGVIERYRAYLPVTEATPVISLSEGSTPLIYSPRLSALVGRGCRIYLKHEGSNPTGSFKDRGMTMAVSKAAESGARLVICASTGNTSAAAAAYAARAGIQCAVLLPAGKISIGKLAQAFVYGAVVLALDGNFDQCLKLVRELATEPGISVVNSINPYRLEGQKTASFEIIDALGDAPHIHVLPVGNAGNTTAYWRGYVEYHKLNRSTRLPRMLGFEAAGAAPIFHGRVIEQPETEASAIRIGNPASWNLANTAFQDSGGAIDIVTDEEIFAAQSWLATKEGLFVEPASAASIAGLFKCLRQATDASSAAQRIPDEAIVVCTLTGHGLKDSAAILNDRVKPIAAPADKSAILSILEKSK